MNKIQNKLYLYCVISLIILSIFLIKVISNIRFENTLLIDTIYIGLFFIFLFTLTIRQFKLYKIGNLILENKILNFNIIEGESIDIKAYISCFGILIGSKVIKYNMGGVDLKGIDIDDKYLNISFGKENKIDNIKLLYGKMDKNELHRFIFKVNFETGIMPKLI